MIDNTHQHELIDTTAVVIVRSDHFPGVSLYENETMFTICLELELQLAIGALISAIASGSTVRDINQSK